MARSGGSIIPAVLFTDLRMPRIGGFEVLEWVKEQPKLRRMACVVISTSELEEDRERAVDCGAYAYLVKHPGAAELKALLHRLATEHAPGRLILHVA